MGRFLGEVFFSSFFANLMNLAPIFQEHRILMLLSACPKSPSTVSFKGWPSKCPGCLWSFLHMLVILRRSGFSSSSTSLPAGYLCWFLLLNSSCSAKQPLNRDSNDGSFILHALSKLCWLTMGPRVQEYKNLCLKRNILLSLPWPLSISPSCFLPLHHVQCLPLLFMEGEMGSKWERKRWSFVPLGTTKLWWGPCRQILGELETSRGVDVLLSFFINPDPLPFFFNLFKLSPLERKEINYHGTNFFFPVMIVSHLLWSLWPSALECRSSFLGTLWSRQGKKKVTHHFTWFPWVNIVRSLCQPGNGPFF